MSNSDSDLLSGPSFRPEDDPATSLNSDDSEGGSIFDDDDHHGMLHQRLDGIASEEAEQEDLEGEEKPTSSIFDDHERAPSNRQIPGEPEEPQITSGGSSLWDEEEHASEASDGLHEEANLHDEEVEEYEEIAQAEGFRSPPPDSEEEGAPSWPVEQSLPAEESSLPPQKHATFEGGHSYEAESSDSLPFSGQSLDRQDNEFEQAEDDSQDSNPYDSEEAYQEEDHHEHSDQEQEEAEERPRYSRTQRPKTSIPMLILAAVLGPVTLLVGYFVYKAVAKSGGEKKTPSGPRLSPEDGGLSTLRDKTSAVSPQPRRQFEESEFRDFSEPAPAFQNENSQVGAGFQEGQEQLAEDRLRLAKILLNKRPKVARQRLQAIVDDYPDTAAAQEARQLLNE